MGHNLLGGCDPCSGPPSMGLMFVVSYMVRRSAPKETHDRPLPATATSPRQRE